MRTSRLGLLVTVALLGSCADLPPGNALWSQFHADGPSAGYVDVPTDDPRQQKWLAEVGEILFASPVVGPDESVVIGNDAGSVFARHSHGLEKWTRHLSEEVAGSHIFSSAAIDADGRVYVIATSTGRLVEGGPERYLSTLYCLGPRSGQTLWTFPFTDPGITTASPKVWGSGDDLVVFVYYRGDDFKRVLYVIDRHGQEVTRARLDCIYPNNIYDGSSDELWERLLIGFLAPFGFSPAFSWRTEIDKETWEELQWEDWPDPTPALIQTPHTQDKRPWVIVADSRCALNAFTWDPVARTLELKWSIDDPADARYSSPTVSPEGFLAVGTSTGFVKAYRLDSGVPWWEYATGEAMIGTPLFSRGHSYNYCFASSDKHLYELVPNGTLSRKIDLHGSTKASPAQSRDRVYISSTAGLFSYPYIGPGGGGVSVPGLPFLYDTKPSGKSSPAIAPNGAIYNVTENYLRAYQRFDPP